MKKRISVFVCISFLSVTLFHLPFADAVRVNKTTEEGVPQKPSGKIKRIGGTCGIDAKKWMKKKTPFKKFGLNNLGKTKVFLAFGESGTLVPADKSEAFIDARQDAYDMATFNAEKKLASFLGKEFKSEFNYSLQQGKKKKKKRSERLSFVTKKEMTLFDKMEKVAHLDLDKMIKDRTPKKKKVKSKPVPKKDIDKAIKLLSEVKFNMQIEAIASHQIKGVRRLWVLENVEKNKSKVCVLVAWSKKYAQMANAIYYGDISFAPKVRAKASLEDQVLDPDDDNNLEELMATFGVDIIRDENGRFVLVSYAQAGAISEDTNHLIMAKEQAELQAQDAIKRFSAKQYKLIQDLQKSASQKTLQDMMSNAKKLLKESRSKKSFDSSVKVGGMDLASKRITGLETFGSWVAGHPATGGVVAGAIVLWRVEGLTGARDIKAEIDKVPEKRLKKKKKRSFKMKQKFRKSVGGSAGKADF